MKKFRNWLRRAFAAALSLAVFSATLTGTAFPAEAAVTSKGTARVDTSVSKPAVESEGAVLYDATDGIFLYEKNADTQFYPASITKVMTALLAAENLDMDDTVTFSANAVDSVESGGTTLGITAGDTFKVSDLMYGLWLHSANEVANGLAEKISGSISAFCTKMNTRAKQLGATHTNFANPNGLNNSVHKTTPHDMALITAAAFENETVRTVAKTLHYTFPAGQSSGAYSMTMGHKMLNPSSEYYYQGFIGGKTGYTSKALNTLVSVAERNGIRLVAVVMKSNWKHYSDSKALFDYGFAAVKSSSRAYRLASTTYSTLGSSNASGSASGKSGTSSGPSASSGSSGTSASSGPSASGSAGSTGSSRGTVSPGSTSGNSSAEGPGSSQSVGSQSPGAMSPSSLAPAQAALTGTWVSVGSRWRFQKQDGSYAASGIYEIKGACYGFGADTYMLSGWQELGGKWYYFSISTGALRRSAWIPSAVSAKRWYYLGTDGAMLTDTVTPDGYRVDGNGAWEES